MCNIHFRSTLCRVACRRCCRPRRLKRTQIPEEKENTNNEHRTILFASTIGVQREQNIFSTSGFLYILTRPGFYWHQLSKSSQHSNTTSNDLQGVLIPLREPKMRNNMASGWFYSPSQIRLYIATRVTSLRPPRTKMQNPIAILKQLDSRQWLMFWAGFLGW